MTTSLHTLIPDPADFLALEPEELGGLFLQYLNSLPEAERQCFHPTNVLAQSTVREYPHATQPDILQALAESWAWLEREGLLVPKVGQSPGWVCISRRGATVVNAVDLRHLRQASLLPSALLHPVLASKVRSAFIRGEYDTAVFQAFKEVEVAVREAGSFPPTELGVALMRKAFEKRSGPLTDTSLPDPEQEAVAHLFAGAIGCYKNPQSHRNVSLADPAETVELLLLASHLLRIVESRRQQ